MFGTICIYILLTNVSLTIYYFALRQMPSHIVWNILSSWRSANLTIVAVQKYSSHIIIPGQHTVMMLVVSPKEIIIARKLPDSAVLGWTFFLDEESSREVALVPLVVVVVEAIQPVVAHAFIVISLSVVIPTIAGNLFARIGTRYTLFVRGIAEDIPILFDNSIPCRLMNYLALFCQIRRKA